MHAPCPTSLARREGQNVVATIESARRRGADALPDRAHRTAHAAGCSLARPGRHSSIAGSPLQSRGGVAARRPSRCWLGRRPGGRSSAPRAIVAAPASRCWSSASCAAWTSPAPTTTRPASVVVRQIAAEIAATPLESTRIVVLIAGCEEAGLLGARAFLRSHDTGGWLFLNFDSVGATGNPSLPAPARASAARWPCGSSACSRSPSDVARERPELGLERVDRPPGSPTTRRRCWLGEAGR